MRTLAAVTAISAGVMVLAGYFLPIPFLQSIAVQLMEWAVLIGAAAALAAIFNLTAAHWRRMLAPRRPDRYSIVLLVGFVITLAGGVYATLNNQLSIFQQAVLAVQVPVESSLFGVLAIILVVAGIRFFRRRQGWMALVFAAFAVLYLILRSGVLPLVAGDQDIFALLDRLPVAGSRGIVLGIALGSLMAGLRVLMGVDRPYSG